MNRFVQSVSRVALGGAKAFLRYPASMLAAAVMAVTATIRVAMDYGNYDLKLFNSMQPAAVLGAFLGMAATAFAASNPGRRFLFLLGNLLAVLAAVGTALYLYLGPEDPPQIVMMRVFAASAVALILFVLILSRRDMPVDFGEMSFITFKSFAIAGIYTLVLLGGLNFIAFAIKSLIIENMSEDVYQHVSIWSGFIGFALFLGYFPDFNPDDPEDKIETAKKHPVFFEILLAYVVVPLMAMMTLVLLIWSIRILVIGELPAFGQLAAIFSSYALIGIGLSILIHHYTQSTAVWFRRLFPFAAIVFLAFEAYAIYDRISQHGLKTLEYFIILIGVYALASAIILMIRTAESHRLTGWVASVLIIFAVLPIFGYSDMPAMFQSTRLQRALVRNQMFADNRIQKAMMTVSLEDREIITDAAEYLLFEEDARRPDWFVSSYTQYNTFNQVFGFEPTRPDIGPTPQPEYRNLYLTLPMGSVSVEGYDFAIFTGNLWGETEPVTWTGSRGNYSVSTRGFSRNGTPSVEVLRNDNRVLYQELTGWLEDLADKYAEGTNTKIGNAVAYDDMIFRAEENGVRIMLVFQTVEINISDKAEKGEYFLTLTAAYLGE